LPKIARPINLKDMRNVLLPMSALFILSCLSASATVYFHADFERGETHTAIAIDPSRNSLKLIPNQRVQEWSLGGGEGVLANNSPDLADTFTYAERRGLYLLGVQGVDRQHPAHTGIRTGDLYEWYLSPSEAEFHGKGNVILEKAFPLFGNFSAKVVGDMDSAVTLKHDLPDSLHQFNQLFLRFYVRFSPRLLEMDTIGLHLFVMNNRKYKLPSISLWKTRKKHNAFFTIKPRAGQTTGILRKQENDYQPIFIVPDQPYCVEFQYVWQDSNVVKTVLHVNGIFRTETVCRLAPSKAVRLNNAFKLGKRNHWATPGQIMFDEFVMADRPIGPKPKTPSVIVVNNNPKLSEYQDAYSPYRGFQWQVNTQNIWLTPAFNSGQLDTALYPFALPQYLKANETFLLRARYLNKHLNWSDWSQPFVLDKMAINWDTTYNNMPQGGRIKDIFFTKVGKNKRLKEIQREKWYELRINFRKLKQRELGSVALWLSGDPENDIGNRGNRAGGILYHAIVINSVLTWKRTGYGPGKFPDPWKGQ